MSTIVRIELRCDEPGCTEAVSYERRDRGGLNVTQARTYARINAGWHTKGKKVWCSEHAAAHRQAAK